MLAISFRSSSKSIESLVVYRMDIGLNPDLPAEIWNEGCLYADGFEDIIFVTRILVRESAIEGACSVGE